MANLNGTSADDTLTGTSSFDTLNGNGGNDMLFGNAGSDTLEGGAGNDLLDGGNGEDSAQYYDATSGVTVDLTLQGSAQATGGDGNDTLISIEDLGGSNYSDVLKGDGNANNIYDFDGGDDQLYGNDGDDALSVGRLVGGATTVSLSGGAGDDMIIFTAGDAARYIDTATLDGGAGSDTIFALGLGTGTILAGSGDDNVTIDSLGGTYTISLGTGSDTLSLMDTSGEFRAAAAITVTDFATGSGGDKLDPTDWLGDGALTNFTSGANPFADGHMRLLQSGTDTLLQVDRNGGANAYSTLITFQNTTKTAFTAANLNGLTPIDFTPGGTFSGTSGADHITGGAGNDFIIASPGHDIIDGGAGTDQLIANLNSTLFPAPTGPRTYTVTADHLSDSSGMLDTSFTNIESVTVYTRDASSFDNVLDASGFTGSGGVQFDSGDGNDRIIGSAGADYLSAGFGNNSVDGGAGLDTAYASIDGTLTSVAYITRSGDITTVSQAGRGTDTYKNVEVLGLYAARDDGNGLHVDASAYDRDLTFSLNQNDIVIGGSGNDTFLGGNGTSDTVATLTGGAGADTYRYYGLPGGLDGTQITDFSIQDRIDLSGAITDAQSPLTFIGSAAFSGVAGQYRFADVRGQTQVQVDNDGDRIADGTLTLTNGAFILVQTAPGSNILKLADMPTASIADVAIVEGGSGTSQAQFTVNLSSPAGGPVTFAYATADGSATAGSDYRPPAAP